MLPVKPVELVTQTPDGQEQFVLLNAPTTGEIYLHQVVRSNAGTAELAVNTGPFFLAVSDTTATLAGHGGTEGPGGTAGGEIGNWMVKGQPAKLRAVPLSGKHIIITVDGLLQPTHIGQTRPFGQQGAYTVVDLAGTGTALTILELVEGRFGAPNARVLARVA